MLTQNLRSLVEATPSAVASALIRSAGTDSVALIQDPNYLRWKGENGEQVDSELESRTHSYWKPASQGNMGSVGTSALRPGDLPLSVATDLEEVSSDSSGNNDDDNVGDYLPNGDLESRVAIMYPNHIAAELGDRGPSKLETPEDQFFAWLIRGKSVYLTLYLPHRSSPYAHLFVSILTKVSAVLQCLYARGVTDVFCGMDANETLLPDVCSVTGVSGQGGGTAKRIEKDENIYCSFLFSVSFVLVIRSWVVELGLVKLHGEEDEERRSR